MVTYKVDISQTSKVSELMKSLYVDLTSKEFKQFIEKKCKKLLDDITREKISSITEEEVGKYYSANKSEITANGIKLYNDSMVDLSNLSEETLANYANGLSLAKIVEFGTGIVGANSEGAQYASDWAYDVNGHGDKGWFYEKNGMIHWSNGIEGRLVFHTLQLKIKENINSWINEYISKYAAKKAAAKAAVKML